MEESNEIQEFRVSPEIIKKLEEYGIKKSYPPGSIILRENTPIRSIPMVIRGTLKILRTDEEGKEILLYYLRGGESCIMSVLGGMHHEVSKVKALVEEDAEILFLPVEKVYYFIREYPQWLDYIFRLYHKRFDELLEIIQAIAFKKLDERLMQWLFKKRNITGKNIISVSHEQIAQELGSSRVVISRLLRQLEEQGQVKLGRNKITLLM